MDSNSLQLLAFVVSTVHLLHLSLAPLWRDLTLSYFPQFLDSESLLILATVPPVLYKREKLWLGPC